MNIFFKVVTSSSETKIDYRSVSSERLRKLKVLLDKDEIEIYCCCKNGVIMKISKTLNPYLYPGNRSVQHASDCVRSPEFQAKIEYEKGWEYDEEEGEYRVKIHDIMSAEIKRETSHIDNSRNLSINYTQSDAKRKIEVTILGLTRKLNMMAWETIVLEREKIPDNQYEVAKYVFGKTRIIYLSNKSTRLQQMYYDEVLKNKKISELQVKRDLVYTYLYFERVEKEQIGKYEYDVAFGKNAFGREIGLYIPDLQDFQEKFHTESHSNRFVLSGFAYRASAYHHRRLTLGSYCLMPVTDQGLFVESNLEKLIYEELYKKNRRFIKPYLPIEHYGEFIPDFIDYTNKEKPIVGEIFGIEGNPDYENAKDKKLALSKSREFTSLYEYWYSFPTF